MYPLTSFAKRKSRLGLLGLCVHVCALPPPLLRSHCAKSLGRTRSKKKKKNTVVVHY
jgi:hypothetical protein